VAEQFAKQTGWRFVASEWTPSERQRIDELAAGKYSQPVWNGKR